MGGGGLGSFVVRGKLPIFNDVLGGDIWGLH